MEDDKVVAEGSDPTDYDEVVITKDTETIDAFLSHVIHAKTKTAYTGVGLNVMTQAKNGSLPQGLLIQNAYTELHSGSKNVTVAVRNGTAYPQTLRKKSPVVRAVVATHISKMNWDDGSIRRGPRPGDSKAVCETKAGETDQGAGFEWIGILAT